MRNEPDELHNEVDATTMGDGLLVFLAMLMLFCTLGAIFWPVFERRGHKPARRFKKNECQSRCG